MKRTITFFIIVYAMTLAAPVGAQWDNSPPSAYPSWQPPSSTYDRITRHSREFDDMQERSHRARWRENQWRRDLDAAVERQRRQAIVPGYIFEGENIRHPSILQTGCHRHNLDCLNRLQSR